MNDWNVVQPKTTSELTHALMEAGVTVIAGGTDVLPGLRRVADGRPVSLVDISHVPDLRFIREHNGCLEIGALTTHAEIAKSEPLLQYAPALVKACETVGAPQTRGRGTLGGNLVNASPAADTAPPLLCLESRVKLVSADGESELPLCEFFRGPGKTALLSGEFLHSIAFDLPSGRWGAGFLKLGRRNGMAIAVASAGVFMKLGVHGEIETIRVILGSVGPTPIRAKQVEILLLGNKPSPELFNRAAAGIEKDISPISDVRATAEYRKISARVLVVRALESAWKQAESRLA